MGRKSELCEIIIYKTEGRKKTRSPFFVVVRREDLLQQKKNALVHKNANNALFFIQNETIDDAWLMTSFNQFFRNQREGVSCLVLCPCGFEALEHAVGDTLVAG